MATLTVGAGQQYSTIKAAVAASKDGDVLEVQAGTYANDFAVINTDITLKGVGGMVHVTNTTGWSLPEDKGLFVTNADVTFDHFEFSGAQASGGAGAGIRYQAGNLVVNNSYFHDNQNGILGAPNSAGTVTISNSEFANNGNPNGGAGTHNLYVNDLAKLTVTNSYFHDVWNEYNLIKSRAQVTEITGSRFQDNDSNASYEIDLPNGGVAILRDNIIEQGSNSKNQNIIAYGSEGVTHSTNSLTIDGNTIVNELQNSGTLVYNPEGMPVTLTNNEIYKGEWLQMPSGGNVSESGTTVLTSKPTLATEWRPWEGGSSAPTPPTETPGTSGADVLNAAAGSDSYIRGGEGADTITGNADHFNNVNGNQGADSIVGHSSVGDWLLGGQGDDLISAVQSSGNNIINGNMGTDNITGGGGADILRGGQGDDVIRGSQGDDWISGDLGANNVVTGGAGADTFHAVVGGTTRVTDFNGAQGDRVDLDQDVTYRLEQQGADLHVVLTSGQGGELVLANLSQANFQSSWIV